MLMSTQDVVARFALHWSEHSKQKQEKLLRDILRDVVLVGLESLASRLSRYHTLDNTWRSSLIHSNPHGLNRQVCLSHYHSLSLIGGLQFIAKPLKNFANITTCSA